MVNAHLAAVVVSFQSFCTIAAHVFFSPRHFFNGWIVPLKTCGGEDVNAENADGARGDFADAAVFAPDCAGDLRLKKRGAWWQDIPVPFSQTTSKGKALGVQLCELLCEQLHLRSRAQRVKDVKWDLGMRLEIHVARGHGRGTGAGQAAL